MDHNNSSQPRLEARVNRKRLYLMLALGIAGYAVMAWFFLDRIERYLLGAAVAIAVGFGVKDMLMNNARIVINERGVLDSRLGFGWISWRDITGVYVTQYQNVDHVCLQVTDASRYLSNRSIATRGLLKFHQKANNISPFSINVGVLDTGADEIYQTIVAGMEFYRTVPAAMTPPTELPRSSPELSSHHR